MTDEFEAKVRACSAHDSQTPLLYRSVEAELRDHLGRTAAGGPAPRASLSTNIAVAALFGLVSASNASGDKWVNGLSSGAC